ncbi:hypothetical protein GCK72_003231 [Caenorhabditis remanei]|uniref:Uncharacterized protein n=1 Tax=Caenorhabditis remanei TaxID=31234 RepID=A0A6A5HUV3_CAERE|nr:hypothetical protein GCK72_003231 [Caenorhabditis remanei]KAF1771405.1 hypothetical protein GCK72_003231 [Caenorhabditis remanei]
MPAPCPETIPPYYTTSLHVIAGFSIPINLIGFYLVWFQSPGMFGYKYCLVYMQTYSSKLYLDKSLIFLTHIFPFATAICMWNSNLTYQQKYDFIKINYPQCLKWMFYDGFEAYDHRLNPMLAVTGIGAFAYVFVVAWYCFYLGIHTMIILQRLRQHMSSQTYQMHKTALISLAMQLVIPGVLIIIPMDLCMFVVLTEANGLQGWRVDQKINR